MARPRFFAFQALLLAPLLFLAGATNDRTITQIVKLLQGMLDKSQADRTAERDAFAKFKCYIDTEQAEKEETIKNLDEQILKLQDEIEQLKASNTQQSSMLAQTKRDIVDNLQQQTTANATRAQRNSAYTTLVTDLNSSMVLMKQAIQKLADIGADQTEQAARDHTEYMAGFNQSTPLNLASLGSTVKKALLASSSLADGQEMNNLEVLLQGPVYSAHSGQVVGILKNMRKTFKNNRAEADATEESEVEAHENFISILVNKQDVLAADEADQKQKISDNDGALSTADTQLNAAKIDRTNAKNFLDALLTLNDQKSTEYDERLKLRLAEESALAEAIAILNSDNSFGSFAKVDATKTGAIQFVQLKSVKKHGDASDETAKKEAQHFLQQAAGKQHSSLIGRVVSLLQASNPFDVVIDEINKILQLIVAEGQTDQENKQWCDTERNEAATTISNKNSEITTTNNAINTLVLYISAPTTGLQDQISGEETALVNFRKGAKAKTEQRTKDNLAYQQDIANQVDAEALLKRAIVVLRQYYHQIDSSIAPPFLLQASPSPPPTWGGAYTGQAGDAKTVIGHLEFVLNNAEAEQRAAHNAELIAQHQYEDDMKLFRTNEASTETNLNNLREELARKAAELKQRDQELEALKKEKAKWEQYVEDIKPGCDFITTNLATRVANRVTETQALNSAKTKLEQSPAYIAAVAQAADDALGDCLTICKTNGEPHATCQACLKKVSVPGYCAGHQQAPGCPSANR